jgi:hypothetical protein
LLKPFSTEKLLTTVRDALHGNPKLQP